ncbi:MAG: hydrogenase maturation protease, partial [Anaerolineae bacterium]|nr:hydrogenase maturation protease [Anaerolineae bacterium]
MDKPVLIIGYGNILRGDDGAGCRAAEWLAQNPHVTALADVLSCQQLTVELSETVSRARLLIFIDADSRLPAGTIKNRVVTPDYSLNPGISHSLSPAQLLGFAAVLFNKTPDKAEMFLIGATSFDFVDRLSPEVEAGLRT